MKDKYKELLKDSGENMDNFECCNNCHKVGMDYFNYKDGLFVKNICYCKDDENNVIMIY